MLPRMVYKENPGQIQTEEPHISGQSVTEFAQYMMDRLCCFIEEVSDYALQAQMPEGFSLTEIPLSQRKPHASKFPPRGKTGCNPGTHAKPATPGCSHPPHGKK